MRIFILVIMAAITCSPSSEKSKADHYSYSEDNEVYAIYEGVYKSEDGKTFYVQAKDSALLISTDSINLYDFADNWADERVQTCNRKSLALIEATINKDLLRIGEIFGDSPIDMNEYIEQYLDMHQDVLLKLPQPTNYEVVNTFYVDEISNHGHESNGWRWTTYCRVFWANGHSRIIRYNWQPKSYFIDEWGLDKPVPFKRRMLFTPRQPFRSRIVVYDPHSKTTKFLRNIDKEDRRYAIPARFVAYNIEINQTVSVRFRILTDEKYMEIGAIEEGLLVKAHKTNGRLPPSH
jgi:hypothetical protein